MRSKRNLWLAAILLMVGLAWAIRAPRAAAQSGKAYYEGKTIKVLVSSSPGGGTDTTARLVAQFLPKYLPGQPQTLVQNMPGGGGTIANNYFTANGKNDGLMLFQDSSSGLGNFTRGGKRINTIRENTRRSARSPAAAPCSWFAKMLILAFRTRKQRKSWSATPTAFVPGSPWASTAPNFSAGICASFTAIPARAS
jgi:hypothetical protein